MPNIKQKLIELENIKQFFENYCYSEIEYEEEMKLDLTTVLPLFLVDGSALELFISISDHKLKFSTNVLEKIKLNFNIELNKILKDLDSKNNFSKLKKDILDEVQIEFTIDLKKEILINNETNIEYELLFYSKMISKVFNFLYSFYTYEEIKSNNKSKTLRKSVETSISNLNNNFERNIKKFKSKTTFKTKFWHEERLFLAVASDEAHLHRVKYDLEEINPDYDKVILLVKDNIPYLKTIRSEMDKMFIDKRVELIDINLKTISEDVLTEKLNSGLVI